MHKLVLGSGAIFFENESDPIIDHIFSLMDPERPRRMVYLPTAGHDDHSYEEAVNDYCYRHGFESSLSLYLTDESLTDEYIRETILSASVIYASGGNLKFLLETWCRRGADTYLRQAYDNGTVIAGQSSGAMCWCRHGYDNCGKDGRFMFLDALGFIPYVMCPHFEDWPEFLENVKLQEYDAIGLDNDIALAIVDGQYTVIDNGLNPRHSAYYMPAEEDWAVHDIYKEPYELTFRQ